VRLIESLATTAPLADMFSDHSLLQAMLEFEVALARAEARLNIIPQSAAKAIAAGAKTGSFDASAIARQALSAGTPAVPLVKELTAQVRAQAPAAAGFVHWGATSQDVCDTALVLLLRKAQSVIECDLHRLEAALLRLSDEHANTVMLGRTLLQAAPPTTFGLKAAGWLAAIHRSRKQLAAAFAEALVLQFGGASGTLAALGDKGVQVGQALAQELHLGYPEAPWHAHRDRLANLVCACGVLTGSLGKMARDISLLMQPEVAEAMEPAGEDRGGSSTMPHKRNPVGCVAALAAAVRVPALVSGFLSAMVQEHERALGGWQAEWPIISGVIQATGLACSAMAETAEGLTVNADQMRANIAVNGAVFAERVVMLLGKKLGRDVVHKLLEQAMRTSRERKLRLGDVLSQIPEVKQNLDPATLREIDFPEQYLGVAEEFRQRLVGNHGTNPKLTTKDTKENRGHRGTPKSPKSKEKNMVPDKW
jgi:3-carboxy-cis,cis-muconate cycloisomerase